MNTTTFFKELSQRLYKENDLSDITWAFANSDSAFKTAFMNFFFPEFGESGEIILEFLREYSRDDSRPDLFIKTDKQEYIIEVKIYDRSHHFKQYISTFPNAKRGYITNYFLDRQEGYEVRTWQGFYNYFEKLNTIDKESLTLYLQYIKSTCNLMKIEQVQTNGLHTLLSFEKILSNAISKCDKNYSYVNVYKSSLSKTNKRYGSYFELENIQTKKKVWPWVGLYFFEPDSHTSSTIIYVEISEKWCPSEFEYLINNVDKLDEGLMYDRPFLDDEFMVPSFTIRMKEEYFKQFTSSGSVEDQEKILEEFISEVLSFVSIN